MYIDCTLAVTCMYVCSCAVVSWIQEELLILLVFCYSLRMYVRTPIKDIANLQCHSSFWLYQSAVWTTCIIYNYYSMSDCGIQMILSGQMYFYMLKASDNTAHKYNITPYFMVTSWIKYSHMYLLPTTPCDCKPLLASSVLATITAINHS